ncbi:FAD-dependent monooxygenase [Streptomyces albicerus]|uniref:FAD-dependent monooxygenase n=1 Tax=Streptomyces albicerus TaxID=2569859 RepID=UPI00124BC0DA|nr:FAD-dependent monooxygenase [Streptomyces albicerus]
MRVVVCGAGPAGSLVALLLAAEGHEVTVLDRRRSAEPAVSADTAPSGTPRGADGPHLLFLREALRLLSDELPGATRELLSAGAVTAAGANVVATRAAATSALAAELSRTEGITTVHGVGVGALLPGWERTPGRPHVRGVRTDTGETVLSDLVVDAAGRDSQIVAMLGEIGAPQPAEERPNAGFRLYTRRFAAPPGTGAHHAGWSVRHFDGVCVAVLSAGERTWSMTLGIDDEDRELRPLAGPFAWNRAAALYEPLMPRQVGSPLPGVRITSRVKGRHRRFVLGGRPVATGVVSVGDAWAATDPLLGLSPSMGVLHALLLREAVRDGGSFLDEVAVRFDRLTEETLTPVYRRVADWEERHRTRRGARSGAPSAAVPAGPALDSAGLARDLQDHFSGVAVRAARTSRTGPARADLLAALTGGRTRTAW